MSKFELNKGDQFILALDTSGSMQEQDCGGMSRLDYCKEQFLTFAREAAKFDPDGVDYLFFNSSVTKQFNQTPEQVEALLKTVKAGGGTDTAAVIKAAWQRAQEIRAGGSEENIVLMLVTDGEPNDQEAVKTAIRDIVGQLKSREEFGIIFLTVGKISAGLQAFLTDLDDNLNAALDIVDVKAFEDVNFTQAFEGAIGD